MPPRKCLSFKEKMLIISLHEKERHSVRDIAKRFNIGKTQSANILKNKEVIKEKFHSGINVNHKKIGLRPKGLQVDKMCYDWFTEAQSKDFPLSGRIVKNKAKEIAELVGYTGFTASEGWLQKWRKRHNIAFKCTSGESSDVATEDNNEFCVNFPTMMNQYRPQDYYNVDESVVISDSEEEDPQEIDSIKSYDEAFEQINRLKAFASGDYVAYQKLNNLESHFKDMQKNCKK